MWVYGPPPGWLTPGVHPTREVTELLPSQVGLSTCRSQLVHLPPTRVRPSPPHQLTQCARGVKARHPAAHFTKALGRPGRSPGEAAAPLSLTFSSVRWGLEAPRGRES